MHVDFAPKLAELVTTYSNPIKAGDFVVITGTTEALPYIEALAVAVVKQGGIPHMNLQHPLWNEYFLANATDEQVAYVSPIAQAVLQKADVLFTIDAPAHTSPLISIPPDRMTQYNSSYSEIQSIFMNRLGNGLRWTLSAWPTPARAQEAKMSFFAYQDFIYRAYALHENNPAEYWHDMAQRHETYTNWLMQHSKLEIKGADIDLTLEYGERNWYSAAGTANFPDGEILCCPIETSVNGTVAFNYPAYHAGTRVDGIQLTFKDGVVVSASATENEDYLLRQLDIDDNARRLGEFAIGTNDFIQTITGSTLLDEKIGGTIHMALGASAAPQEGKNPSKIHWDIVHDMRQGGEMLADGKVFYRDGKFLI